MDETLADDMAVWTWRRWRPWLVPALVRGAVWGAALALLVCAPIAITLVATGSTKDLAGVVVVAVLCLAAGVVGGAPTVPLEGRARGRSAAARAAHAALSGGVGALGWVVVVAQVAYLVGVLRGGMERGLGELGRLVGGILGDRTSPGLGLVVGALLAFAVAVGLAVLLRLQGRPARLQVGVGCASVGCGGIALVSALTVATVVITGGGPHVFDRAMEQGGPGAVVAMTFMAAITFAFVAPPLTIVAPLALALADRLSPLPAASPTAAGAPSEASPEGDQPAG